MFNQKSLKRIELISKPGKRKYLSVYKLKQLDYSNLIYFLSTTKGVITKDKALKFNVGGELLFCIFI